MDLGGRLLVSCQFLLIAFLLYTTSWVDISWPALLLFCAAVLLACWSFWVMRPGTFNIRPVLKDGAQLVTTGPYVYARNPMYSSVLLAASGSLVINCSGWRGVAFVLLAGILFVKIIIEEEKLAAQFVDYAVYRDSTGRFIPSLRANAKINILIKKGKE